MSSPLVVVAVLLIAGLLAWFMRRAGGGGDDSAITRAPESEGAPETFEADDEDDDDDVQVAVTSNGEVLIPFGHGLRVVMLDEPERLAEHRGDIEAGLMTLDSGERTQLARARGGSLLRPGDLTAARIGRGGAEEAPWRVETLGRDGDYGHIDFESEHGVRAAYDLLERAGVVRRTVDEDGQVVPPSAEDFEEARRRYEETERELALGIDPDDPEPRPDWSSRR